jgi:hypothetical protein
MRNLFILFILMLMASSSYAQILGGAGVCHTNGDPDGITALQTQDVRAECLVAWDTANNALYVYEYDKTVNNRWTQVPLSQVTDTDTRVDSISVDATNLILHIRDMKTGVMTGTTRTIPLISVAPVRNVTAGNGISVSNTSGTFQITASDISNTNEGTLGVAIGGESSSVITSNTSGATGVTINASGMVTLTETANANGGSITIGVPAQTLSVANTTNPALNISNATSPITFTAGAGIASITGSGGNTITFVATDQSASNELQSLSFTTTADSVNLNILSSTGVRFVKGTGITFSSTGTQLAISAVDASVSNEGSLSVEAGSGTSSIIRSNTSGSSDITLNAGNGLSISEDTNTENITITNTMFPSNAYDNVDQAKTTGGLTVGQYFYASVANSMGVVPGTLIRVSY